MTKPHTHTHTHTHNSARFLITANISGVCTRHSAKCFINTTKQKTDTQEVSNWPEVTLKWLKGWRQDLNLYHVLLEASLLPLHQVISEKTRG